MPERVAAVVLAAGRSTRMGENKLLLRFRSEPLLIRAVRAAVDAGCEPVVVVVSDPVVAAVVSSPATVVNNPRAELGVASSIAVGLEALPAEIESAIILLADQPLVDAGALQVLLRAASTLAAPAVAAMYADGEWRPPVLVRRSIWPLLTAMRGDLGARQVFSARPELLETVPTGLAVCDIDTPEDFDRLLRGERSND